MAVQQRPVLVVGAGPAGFGAALALRSRGLPVTVLEAEQADRVRPGSRALFVHQESLRLLDKASPGLAARIVAHGAVWPTKRTFFRGREVFARTYPPAGGDRLPRFTSLRQIETEKHLHAACLDAGVDIEWGARAETVTTDANGVSLRTADGRDWRAQYVVAADGAHSVVRKQIGITWEGTRSEGFHVVVDVLDDSMPLERVFHYRHPALGGRNVMRVPFAGGFQVDLQCGPDDDADRFASPDGVERWLPKVVDAKYAEQVVWISKYHYLHVVARSFVDSNNRVLLVGEAAHLFPPFGARGMNSGFADGAAAADAVESALESGSSKAIKDFDHDRGVAARFNSEAARLALSHMRPTSALMKLRQEAAATLSPVIPWMGSWLEHAPYGPRTGATASGKY
ncbi:FAD-dependent monooxygenase [Kibdelosporangium phytohabitans]|uniref:Monooxygenase n=1 Tax=Kibdelosporangium phytohabitans TaxID=860235 RepID=A0A0N9HU54_9PSEU|nr:FAD-dependent monooxygenase [Kibdelosporangium phytohabitans]ALG08709.1 monooxygenase [Kibdelosporangium phytohabitans]MBE1470180.1 3-(3-hydroxy-phenyl)propionate hydroxylase [Kibdelosporangium phytohabitans]